MLIPTIYPAACLARQARGTTTKVHHSKAIPFTISRCWMSTDTAFPHPENAPQSNGQPQRPDMTSYRTKYQSLFVALLLPVP